VAGKVEWVAVDWGTSNVRAWGIDIEGSVAFSTGSDRGMGRIGRADYPGVLNELIADLVPGPAEIVICGMAGARQGWLEAPYLDTPASLHELRRGAAAPAGADSRFAPRILPGVCQRTPGHEDVMRGEETQLLGLLGLRPGFAGTVILPGTHSKWVTIDDGRITRFETAMTGELYELLAEHSVLRHSLSGERVGPATDEGFAEGMGAGLARPEIVTALAFRTRAASLLADRGTDWCAGYLSGLLIGAEVGGHQSWLSGRPVPLIGSERLSKLYATALKSLGIASFAVDAAEATIAGLKEARAQ
jgi:2-dehydro-3-deoxygalactonokinase